MDNATELELRCEAIAQVIYRDLDDQKLRDMLLHGNEFPLEEHVVALNKSIQNELDRREQERRELEGKR